ncbi:MAG: aldolase/citrate lyase family protein [Bacteroidota bacterium]
MHLRSRLQTATTLFNIFQVTPTPWVAEWLGAFGAESITLDLQHGMIEPKDLLGMLQGVKAGGALPLARLAWNRPEQIMKALDYGVEGLICPMIDNATDAAAFVRAAKYPPLGNRSFGPFRAALQTKQDYFATANDEILCFAMIETAGAAADLENIAATPGLDGLYVGPFDLSVSLGLERQADFSDPALLAIIDQVLNLAQQHNLFSGVFTVTKEDAQLMAGRGFDVVTCGTENMIFQAGMKEWLSC